MSCLLHSLEYSLGMKFKLCEEGMLCVQTVFVLEIVVKGSVTEKFFFSGVASA